MQPKKGDGSLGWRISTLIQSAVINRSEAAEAGAEASRIHIGLATIEIARIPYL